MALEQKTISGCFYNAPLLSENLFDESSAVIRESFTRIKQKKQFKEDCIVAAKDEVPNIYLLREGGAEIFFFNEINQQEIKRLIEKNEIIGLTETIANLHFQFDIKTITPCTFEFVDRTHFMRFLYDQPEVCFRLLKTLGSNLNESYQNFSSSTF